MKKVLGIGNALIDALIRLDDDGLLSELDLPKGSMQLIDAERQAALTARTAGLPRQYATGGSACNTILALGCLGASPGLVGKVGDDANGHFFEESCRRHGIASHLLHDAAHPTGVASTLISPDGERTFGTHLGAAAYLRPGELPGDLFGQYGYFYIEGYLVQDHALIRESVRHARHAGLCVCIDMASYNIVEAERTFFDRLLDDIDIVFANEEEAHALTRLESPAEALEAIAQRGVTAVVKLGGRGAIAQKGDEHAEAAAVSVPDLVDTTAAGDFFAAGFLYGHAHHEPLGECLRKGNHLAAHVIRTVGTALSEDTWQQIRHELRPAAENPSTSTATPTRNTTA